jgi:uncharacterized tellurite resistance protein B-like protein
MLDSIRRFIQGEKADSAETAGGDADVRVAACALLLEVAATDGELSEPEREAILDALRDGLGVPAEEVDEILETSRSRLEGSIDLWTFTSLVNRQATIAEKERSQEPVEVEEKRELERLHQAVVANETVKAFMRAQADYAELMKRMNDAIYGQLRPPGEEPPTKTSSPSGS